tara:strand:- start:359 stop:487 length:129 start_codon:yes stop_codon:yes gene_type:complete
MVVNFFSSPSLPRPNGDDDDDDDDAFLPLGDHRSFQIRENLL